MIVQRALQSLGIAAMGDPPPGAGRPAGLSGRPSRGGNISLVGSLGKARSATYRQIYLMNPWVYAATNHIARGVGRLPLHVYSLDEKARKTRIRGDVPQTPGRPIAGVNLDRLLSNPEQGLSRQAFLGSTMRDRLVYGNGLWEIIRDGAPAGLRRISWSRVSHIEEDSDGNAAWYEVAPAHGLGGATRKIMARDVVHFGLGADSDSAWNVSLLESCHHTLALHEAVMRHLMKYLENQVRPSGQWKADNAKAAREARELITELYASPENAGKALVTNAEWQSMGDSPDHAQLVQLIQESRLEIIATFQTPPPTVGLLDNAIRANVKELREQMGRDVTGVWAAELEGEITAQLLPQVPSWSSLFVEFQLAEVLRPDLEARALVYQRLMWIFSIDEIRGFENAPPFDLAGVTDVPWVASGAMPVTTAAKQTPRGQRAAAPPPAGAIKAFLESGDPEVLVAASAAQNGNGHHELSEEP